MQSVMRVLKNIQTILDVPYTKGHNFLKFCYFIGMTVLLSCGEQATSVENTKTESTTTEEPTSETDTPATETGKTLLFFGDSITAGYGLDDTNDAYPNLIQKKIDSLDMDYTVVNSGVSGETTAGGLSRIQWILNQEMEVFVLELGANDGLRGTPLSETRANLQAIIDAVRADSPETTIVLAGMQLPPNMGLDYTTGFKRIFEELAAKNDLPFIPFILKDVGGIAALNQSDGIHPTEEGHQIVANTVWEVLKTVL